jgi:hypothetical protein
MSDSPEGFNQLMEAMHQLQLGNNDLRESLHKLQGGMPMELKPHSPRLKGGFDEPMGCVYIVVTPPISFVIAQWKMVGDNFL